jgi:two-component system, cell cycle sensor histidine kinase and response regulator CckA
MTNGAADAGDIAQQHPEALARRVGSIAHDFNNLLAVIVNCAALAYADLASDHPSRADIDAIRRAANEAAALTRQLLAIGRGENGAI